MMKFSLWEKAFLAVLGALMCLLLGVIIFIGYSTAANTFYPHPEGRIVTTFQQDPFQVVKDSETGAEYLVVRYGNGVAVCVMEGKR